MAAVVTRDVLAKKLADRAEITVSAARDEVRWFFETIAGSLEKGDEVLTDTRRALTGRRSLGSRRDCLRRNGQRLLRRRTLRLWSVASPLLTLRYIHETRCHQDDRTKR